MDLKTLKTTTVESNNIKKNMIEVIHPKHQRKK